MPCRLYLCVFFNTGHGATVHAATIEDGSLVGMGATVLDGAKVGFTLRISGLDRASNFQQVLMLWPCPSRLRRGPLLLPELY